MFNSHVAVTSCYPVEVLLNNHLDKEVQAIFYPFNFLLTISMSSKYCIRDNYITPTQRKFHILRFVCTVALLVIYDSVTFKVFAGENIIFYIARFLSVIRNLTFLQNVAVSILCNQDNVLLVVLIQMIHRSIDLSNKIRSFIAWNWIIIATISAFNIMVATAFSSGKDGFNFIGCFTDVIYTSFDVDFVYSIRVLNLLNKYLYEWIKSVRIMNEGKENDKMNCTKLLKTYENILRAYDVYKKVTQYLVSILRKGYIILCFSITKQKTM
ncbi:hypothetical protein B5X24_HaOG200739 [Helicoverpa armigera]|uniref:Gustatory receptor n=1 Tax=Helicoverpa armigera TaxID=29058 RepID=A0A2W1BPV8_HELAM|nr:hypothetical protein B5X24_HaOG200739 [Helicoverpa armigera]